MTDTGYTILAYSIGFGLMWGYAASVWLKARAARRAAERVGRL